MRQFGGSEALPDLTELLDDNEPQVQREAVRAIRQHRHRRAPTGFSSRRSPAARTQSRDAIMQSIGLVRDERATPLFAYILRPHRSSRPARAGLPARDRVARRAARSRQASRRCATRSTEGEWWAPRAHRAALRDAAAAALAAHRHRPTRSPCSTKRSRRRLARRAHRPPARSSRASRAARDRRRAGEATHERAAFSARRRAAPPLRRVAPRRRSSTRRAIRSSRATSSRCRPRFRCCTASQPTVTIGLVGDEVDRRRHADGEGRHARSVRPPAAAGRRRADHDRPRRHARRRSPTFIDARSRRSTRASERRGADVSDARAHPRRPRHGRAARRGQPHRHGDDQAALQRRRVGRRRRLGQRADRGRRPTPSPRAR